jgi:hypothetical protein
MFVGDVVAGHGVRANPGLESPLDSSYERVSVSAPGYYPAWIGGIGFALVAQTADVHIDDARIRNLPRRGPEDSLQLIPA